MNTPKIIAKFRQLVLENKVLIVGMNFVFLVTFLTFEKTLNMYFWSDDYSVLYKLQHPQEEAGVYGPGIIGRDSPFRYNAMLYYPIYKIFGLDARVYFLGGILLYFLASLTVYFFAKTLTGNKKIALAASLIFASGYVGSNSLYAINNSFPNIVATISITLTVALYFKFTKYKDKNFRLRTGLYILTLMLFISTVEVSFLRSTGILLSVLAIEALFNFNLPFSALRASPFVLTYWYYYVYSIRNFLDQSSKTTSLIQNIFVEKNYHYLLTPLKTLENILIPDKLNLPLIVFLVLLIGVLVYKKSKTMVYCLIFIISNYIIYFYVSQEAPQETTHRYLTVSFVGASVFLSLLLNSFIKRTAIFLTIIVLIVSLNLTFARSDQKGLLKSRSQPSQELWQSLKNQIPSLSKESVIYVDVRSDGISSPAYDNTIAVGGMGVTTSVAVQYGLKWTDLYLPETFPELITLVTDKKVSSSNIYTFFYSRESGLVNTTESTKKALFSPPSMLYIESLSKIDTPATSPSLLEFLSNTSIDFSETKYSKSNDDTLSKYLPYLASKRQFFERATVTASSQAKYAQIENIKDEIEDSSWVGTNDSWYKDAKGGNPVWERGNTILFEQGKEEIVFDLKEIKSIGAVKITPGSPKRIPTHYTYECSLDGITWNQIQDFNKKIENAKVFIDRLPKSTCVFIKLTIFDTAKHDPPQIAEAEIIEEDYANLDFELASQIKDDPFQFVKSQPDQRLLQDYFNTNGIDSKVCIYTDKYKPQEPNCKNYNLKRGISNNSLLIDQGGTTLQKVEFKVPPQIKINTKNITLKPLTINELEKEEYR